MSLITDLSNFSWVNQQTSTAVASNGTFAFNGSKSGVLGHNVAALTHAIPGSTYTILLKTSGNDNVSGSYNSLGNQNSGIILRDSSSAKLVLIIIGINGTCEYAYFTNPTTYYGTSSGGLVGANGGSIWPFWKLVVDATNRILYRSPDGVNYYKTIQTVYNDFLTPDQCGFGMNAYDANASNNFWINSYAESSP